MRIALSPRAWLRGENKGKKGLLYGKAAVFQLRSGCIANPKVAQRTLGLWERNKIVLLIDGGRKSVYSG
jgi:hypothetical protein